MRQKVIDFISNTGWYEFYLKENPDGPFVDNFSDEKLLSLYVYWVNY